MDGSYHVVTPLAFPKIYVDHIIVVKLYTVSNVVYMRIYVYIYRLKAGGSPELPGTLSFDM